MTGFGRGRAEQSGVTAVVELRSVNKRFLEVSLRLPSTLSGREPAVEAHLKDAFERGRFTVRVQLDREAERALPVTVDEEAAAAYARLLEALRVAAGLSDPVRLEHLLHFSDVFTNVEAEKAGDGDTAWPAVEAALDEAVGALRTMRREEGRALRDDLEAHLEAIEIELNAVEARAPERVAERRDLLRDRLDALFDDERLARERLEAEAALLSDRLDVTEECVRLRSHLGQFRRALDDREPAGRRLKFLVQEIHREANTIGAKANDAEIAHRAVAMKEAVEKIREQVQNVE